MVNKLFCVLMILILCSCEDSRKERAEKLYRSNCGSCHVLPSPADLPKTLWQEAVLPEMAARIGIRSADYNPYSGYSFKEQEVIMKTGIYSKHQIVSQEEWKLIESYILDLAPDEIDSIPKPKINKLNTKFTAIPVNLDSAKGSSVTFLEIKPKKKAVVVGDYNGRVLEYNHALNKVDLKDNFNLGVTSHIERDSFDLITIVGNLNPSEIPSGVLYQKSDSGIDRLVEGLHRPVHSNAHDLNNNGTEEILISEFGNLTGKLSLITKNQSRYTKNTLLGQPGVIRTIIKDMNDDGKADIIALNSQGNEGVTILYQTNELKFDSQQVLRFNPVFGTSWFELLDVNNDGFDDIITAHGDNADKTFVPKPYHGIRIHLNDGNNQFNEAYFFPLNGATRFVAHDFNQDGDIDIAVVASFPDYETSPELSFVYLENSGMDSLQFKAFALENYNLGRWLVVDSADLDNDGDEDLVLGSFTYYFTPVPDDLFKEWSMSNTDLLVLENNLFVSKQNQ